MPLVDRGDGAVVDVVVEGSPVVGVAATVVVDSTAAEMTGGAVRAPHPVRVTTTTAATSPTFMPEPRVPVR
jgi:hypothetical protein